MAGLTHPVHDPGSADAVRAYLRHQIAEVLQIDAATLSESTPFSGLGVDSLMGLELINRVSSELDFPIPDAALMENPSLKTLTDHILRGIEARYASAIKVPVAAEGLAQC